MKRFIALGCLLAAVSVHASAQQRMRRASITGDRGDNGKCTIEVDVDDAAEVEIWGDQGRLITVSGQPSEWRRFQCSEPLPRDPGDFRFRGIDGRGRVNLLRDPRNNRGVAVVRIDDTKGGREGYTFDLEWRGGSNYRRGEYGGYGPGYDGDRRGNGGYGRGNNNNSFIVSCASDDMRRNYCDTDTRNGVRLVRQRSEAACRQGVSWGYDRRGIWVDRGCRADFEVGSR